MELLIRQIRMSSCRVAPLSDELSERLTQLFGDIECWHLRQQCLQESEKGFSDQEQAFTDVVIGLFDAFYYLGWSARKPVAELTADDLDMFFSEDHNCAAL